MNLYDFRVKTIDGQTENLSKYKGKVVLIVNTATHCIFTPQLQELEKLYKAYNDKGLEILAFPCDQFASEAPGSNIEIAEFCSKHYDVTFPQYAKIDVNGQNAIPLYKWITDNTVFSGIDENHKTRAFSKLIGSNDINYQKNGKIKWNFTKILIDQNGNIVERFESPVPTKIIELKIKKLLHVDDKDFSCFRNECINFSASHIKFRKEKHKYIGLTIIPIIILFWLATSSSILLAGGFTSIFRILKTFAEILPLAIATEVGLFFILRKFEKRSSGLSDALERATSGDLDYRFTWKPGDPMAPIYANYNQMCMQLKAYRAQMEEAVENANRASEAKSSFLSNMSHEIRTPINAILGLDEMIVRESRESNIKSYAIDIKSAGRSLLSLVNDILDFSKIESGKMDIIPVEYDLSSVINDLINMNSDKAQKKGLELRINVEETIPKILYGDEIRIKQIALNILSNAVKYTDKGSIELRITHKRTDAHNIILIFHIIDTGKGIKTEDLDKLFKPFERIEEKRNRTIEGTGLGMNITKQLLDLMDSRLEVDSIYGKGSDFSFQICQEIVNDIPIGNFAESFKKAQESVLEYHESFHAPNARILVVDDVDMNLTVFTSLLKMTQIQIDTANSGRECIELADLNKYNIIFIDHMMPDMDGIETLDILRRECPKNFDTPVIILTANAISGAREEYMSKGFSDYLTKPIDCIKLENTIVSFLPDELVIKDFSINEIKSEMVSPESSSVESYFAKLCKIQGIDTSSGIRATGSIDTYVTTAKNFASTGKSRCDLIKKYYDEMDIKNYIIQVHALKSSARLIGADALSNAAKYLEQMGHDENLEQIKSKTDALLDDYSHLYTLLSQIFTVASPTKELKADSLKDMLCEIRDAVNDFDYNRVDEVIEELDKYKMPDDFKESFETLKVMVTNIDQDGILDVINSYC